jgi:DNA-binding NarL/FixJ family response regulator
VIMFTAGPDPNAGQEFLDAGAAAFVSKEASMELLATIKRLCANAG